MPAVPGRLKGKVSVVSGGGNGIGTGICERLASEGAFVWVLDIDEPAAKQVAASLKGKGFAAEAALVSQRSLPWQGLYLLARSGWERENQ